MQACNVIMYHYVRDLKNSFYPDIKGLELKEFENHIKFLIKEKYKFITVVDIINACVFGGKMPRKSVLLTFDDAYLDHYLNVFPILNEYGIQGCFYVPVKAITKHEVLDVNKIHFVLAACKDKQVLIKRLYALLDEYKKDYNLQDNEYYYKKLAVPNRWDTADIIFIKRLLQAELPEEVRNIFTNILFKEYVTDNEAAFSRSLYMNEAQLKCMYRNGMHIGAHGYDHYWLNSLDSVKQESEIIKSLQFLEQIGVKTEKEGWTICYPYGAYDDRLLALLKKYNCKLGFTTVSDKAILTANNIYKLARFDANDVYNL